MSQNVSHRPLPVTAIGFISSESDGIENNQRDYDLLCVGGGKTELFLGLLRLSPEYGYKMKEEIEEMWLQTQKPRGLFARLRISGGVEKTYPAFTHKMAEAYRLLEGKEFTAIPGVIEGQKGSFGLGACYDYFMKWECPSFSRKGFRSKMGITFALDDLPKPQSRMLGLLKEGVLAEARLKKTARFDWNSTPHKPLAACDEKLFMENARNFQNRSTYFEGMRQS